jgi:hypothetical protein
MNNEEIKVNKDLVKVAVEYWSGFLKNPMSFEMDNGEPSQHAMLNILAKAGAKPFPEEGVLKFEEILGNYIKNALEIPDSGRVAFEVDYHPCNVLRSCLDQAFGENGYSSMTVFPCKTDMRITIDYVKVWQGYRAPVQILFQTNTEK